MTRLGQRLLQHSNQGYVYSVLGAQAKTRWKIVGSLGNSYETQQVFRELLKDILAQDKLITLIKSMRLAIKDTRVKLDYVLSPGIEILPSQMIFIKDSVGYNNTLLVSSSEQSFGFNKNINTTKKHPIANLIPEKERNPMSPMRPMEPSLDPIDSSNTQKNEPEKESSTSTKDGMSYLEIGLISVTIAVVGRILWVNI